jgi:hypothetical protein
MREDLVQTPTTYPNSDVPAIESTNHGNQGLTADFLKLDQVCADNHRVDDELDSTPHDLSGDNFLNEKRLF